MRWLASLSSLVSKIWRDFDIGFIDDAVLKWQEEFEATCKKIVTEIQDKFIDLNIGDDESGFGGEEMLVKQETFQKDMATVDVTFNSQMLDLPTANTESEASNEADLLEQMDKQD